MTGQIFQVSGNLSLYAFFPTTLMILNGPALCCASFGLIVAGKMYPLLEEGEASRRNTLSPTANAIAFHFGSPYFIISCCVKAMASAASFLSISRLVAQSSATEGLPASKSRACFGFEP